MEINIEERGAVSIVTVPGEFIINQQPGKFRDIMKGLLEKGHTQLVIDLHNVKSLNSIGMGSLVQTFKLVRDHGGRMVFVNPGVNARKVIELTRIDQVFSFYDSVQAALEGLNTDPAPLST